MQICDGCGKPVGNYDKGAGALDWLFAEGKIYPRSDKDNQGTPFSWVLCETCTYMKLRPLLVVRPGMVKIDDA